jgi:hypothetical protein
MCLDFRLANRIIVGSRIWDCQRNLHRPIFVIECSVWWRCSCDCAYAITKHVKIMVHKYIGKNCWCLFKNTAPEFAWRDWGRPHWGWWHVCHESNILPSRYNTSSITWIKLFGFLTAAVGGLGVLRAVSDAVACKRSSVVHTQVKVGGRYISFWNGLEFKWGKRQSEELFSLFLEEWWYRYMERMPVLPAFAKYFASGLVDEWAQWEWLSFGS